MHFFASAVTIVAMLSSFAAASPVIIARQASSLEVSALSATDGQNGSGSIVFSITDADTGRVLTTCPLTSWTNRRFPTAFVSCSNNLYKFKFPRNGFVAADDFTLDLEFKSANGNDVSQSSLQLIPEDFTCQRAGTGRTCKLA